MKKKPDTLKAVLLMFWFICLVFLKSWAGQAEDKPLRYDLEVELLPEVRMIQARGTIVWSNLSQDYVPDIQLHLYWNAFKNELSTMAKEARRETMYKRYQVRKDDWGYLKITSLTTVDGYDLMPTAAFISPDEPPNPDDQTVLKVDLPEPLAPGQSIILKLQFQAKVPQNGIRVGCYKDGFFISQWFPKPGVYEEGKGWNCHQYHLNSEFFADFADFKVQITVPQNLVVGACGEEIERIDDPVTGKTTYTFEQQNIHDFAWTASPRFIKIERWFRAEEQVSPEEYQTIAELLELTPEEIKLPDVRMILLIEKQHQHQAERHFKALMASIKYYGLWYGPYPYRTITMVDPPFRTGSGGMEYPTLFTAGTSVILDKKVLSPEQVIVHEFGHNYWYGLVANNEFEEAWLDEGINTYSTAKVLEAAYGPSCLPVRFNGLPLNWLLKTPAIYDWQLGRLISGPVAKLDPIVKESWKFYNSVSYSLNVYYRAATCLQTLERYLGEKSWAKIMRTYHMRYRFKHPTIEDFIQVVKEVSAKDLNWFFKEFFFKAKDFDYAIGAVETRIKPEKFLGIFDDLPTKHSPQTKTNQDETTEKAGEKIYQTSVTLRRYGQARLGPEVTIKLKVEFEDGSLEWREWDGQSRWVRFNFEKPVKMRQAVLDPEAIWLVDTNLSNNYYALKGSREKISGLTGDFLWLMQSLLLSVFNLL